MSIEKFRPEFEDGFLKHESKPYTQILNMVLQLCTNAEALGVWCYLQSRPENWVVSPQHLQNHFNIGRDKVYKIINYLISTNLLIRDRQILPDGTYGKTNYIIRNGDQFQDINLSTDPLPEKPYPDNPYPVNQYTTNKRAFTNTKENKKKREYARKNRVPLSDDFIFESKTIQAAQQVSDKVGKPVIELIAKFRLLSREQGRVSQDWNAAFEKFLIDERPTHNKTTKDYTIQNFTPYAVPDYVEPKYEVRRCKSETVSSYMDIIKKNLGLKSNGHGKDSAGTGH